MATLIVAGIVNSTDGFATQYTWTNSSGDRLLNTPGNYTPNWLGANIFDTLIFNGYSDTVFLSALNKKASFVVTGNANIKFVANIAGSSSSTPTIGLTGLQIDDGSKMTLGGTTNPIVFSYILGSNTGNIFGELVLDARNPGNPGASPNCEFNTTNTGTPVNFITPNGIFRMAGPNSRLQSGFISGFGFSTKFNDGTQFILERDGGFIGNVVMTPASTIKITGQTANVAGILSNTVTWGNITWDCPNQVGIIPNMFGGLTTSIKGNLTINNTGSGKVGWMGGIANFSATGVAIDGNLTVKDDIDLGNASGTSLYMEMKVKGNYTQTGGIFDLSPNGAKGILKVAGSFTQTGGSIRESGTSQNSGIEFNGTVQQTASAVSIIDSLDIIVNNAANVSLGSNAVVFDSLIFTSGKVLLNNFNLGVGSVYNADNSKYVVTNGTGALALGNVSSTVFPVGPSTSSYNPLTVTGGGIAAYGVRVSTPIVPAPSTIAATINRQWTIAIAGGTPVGNPNITFQYNDADAGVSCNPAGTMEIGRLNGASWIIQQASATPVGAGPRTVTATGVSTLSALPSSFILGNLGSITPVRNIDRDVNAFRLLPSVTNNTTKLEIVSSRADVMTIRITDISGRVVEKLTRRITAGINQFDINCGNFSIGVYNVTGITSKGVTQSVKLVKQ